VPTTCLRSRWLLPIDRPPIPDGWVEIAAGRIVDVGAGRPPSGCEDLGDVAVLPGIVNAHTHLELSWMAGRIPAAGSMVEWIRTVIDLRRSGPGAGQPGRVEAAIRAAGRLAESGTTLVGDVTNSLETPAVLADLGLSGTVFHELLGFNALEPVALVQEGWRRVDEVSRLVDPSDIRFGLAAHAPYSTAPAIFSEIARTRRDAPLAVHLAESAEEVEFLHSGRGPFRELLEDVGVWTSAWAVPHCDPVEFLSRLGYLVPGLIVVHGVHLEERGLERLREAGAVLVTCPRSNAWVGGGLPPVSRFYASGIRVAIGTDSLASVDTLNVFDELAELRRIAPEVSAACLLESATRMGAEALGFGAHAGTITPGKRAALVAVEVPGGLGDVEEYLVGGVPASRVRRIPASR
jgi:aminodeoxyfutalosine deaminase